MPIFDFKCSNCGEVKEVYTYNLDKVVTCDCGLQMEHRFSAPPMIKIRGAGGYPSRRKQIRNTTTRNHPKLEHEPNRVYI